MPTNQSPLPTLSAALDAARHRLGRDGELDAAVLLCHLLGVSRAYLHAWPERVLTANEEAAFVRLVERRAAGEPLAYITGRREFWSLELVVTPETLIPRPDTETLVAEAIARIPADTPCRVADLGTGSGAIALAIASERPSAQVVATDASPGALNVARENARRLGLPNVTFRQGSWFVPLEGERFHLIVSNPPYIPEADPHLASGELRFEPRSALSPGADGLADIRMLVAGASRYLEPGGWLLLEHGYDQGSEVRAFMDAQSLVEVTTYPDLENRDRITVGRYGY